MRYTVKNTVPGGFDLPVISTDDRDVAYAFARLVGAIDNARTYSVFDADVGYQTIVTLSRREGEPIGPTLPLI